MKRAICALFLALAAISSPLRAQPDKGYDVISYDATITLDRQTDSIVGVVKMTARADSAITAIVQYAKYLQIDRTFVGGRPAIVTVLDTLSGRYDLEVFLDKPLKANDTFTVVTYFRGRGETEQGTMRWGGVTNSDSMMFAMGVGFKAPYTGCTRHWLPCYDLPDDKPDSVDLTFICREGDVTASNGLLVSDMVVNGWRTMHWHESKPIATYLMMFATGPYVKSDISNSLKLPFEVYSLKRDSAIAATHMNVRVRDILAFYDSLFAPYPFEKVGYVVTPIGSMEHQTMICLDKNALVGDSAVMVSDVSNTSTIAVHELAHMWWGDRVTCKTFDDAWLNEGFARYCESLTLERLFGRAKYVQRQHDNAFGKGQTPGAISSKLPLFGAPTVNNHTNNYPFETMYQKGSVILAMLRQILGDSLFFEAVRYYGNTHAYNTATSYDLWHDFEHTTGQDLGWFFKPWVFATGYPKDTIEWTPTSDGASIAFHQVYNNDSARYFRLPIVIRAKRADGFTRDMTVWMDSVQNSTVLASFGFTPESLTFDPDGMILWKVIRSTKLQAGVEAPTPTSSFRINFIRPYLTIDSDRPLGDVHIVLTDIAGRAVRSADTVSYGNHLRYRMNVEGLATAQYCFKVFAGDRQTGLCTIIGH
jgi:aminopeptidase N